MNSNSADDRARRVLLDLGLRSPSESLDEVSLSADLRGFFDDSSQRSSRIAWELSLFCGVSNDWALALKFVDRFQQECGTTNESKLWQFRCLVELGMHAEAVALSSSQRWAQEEWIHVNYLTGLAFEGLGLREQARGRFLAVAKENRQYRNVAEKLGPT